MDEDLPTFINHGLRVQSSDLPKVSVDDWELTLINRSHCQEDGVANKIAEIAPKYGFILRYPEGKSDITGVNFENWHYRYVGVESAQYMQKHHLVLEEYLTLLKESAR